jgi:hypothetical protein
MRSTAQPSGDARGELQLRFGAAAEASCYVGALTSLLFGTSVRALEECNPREKAWLVLFDHIGRMVGQTRTLHAATERCEVAAYQRQAAQRLVTQLEEYGGAMLCDGVGLGKTYVATTVVVHYANLWRDQLVAARRTASDDLFRVTVLSPNSVVSTWLREAIAPLAAHGVPLATIRVLSHSKLSRIVPSSDILERGRSGMSEQIAGYQQRLRRLMGERGIEPEWVAAWNGWLREVGGRPDDRILAWARLGRKGGRAPSTRGSSNRELLRVFRTGSGRRRSRRTRCSTFGSPTTARPSRPRRAPTLATQRMRRGQSQPRTCSRPRGASSMKTWRSRSWATCGVRFFKAHA